MEFLYKPQEDISYSFIVSMYSIGVVIGVVLIILDLIYKIEEVKGFWIIFAPFSICLIWGLIMKHFAEKNFKNKKED